MAKKILVVDDEPDLLQSMAMHLVNAGYQVVTALDGREALQKAEAERPDLIVLDHVMPSMDGLDVLRSLRVPHTSATRDIPVIMATAEPEPNLPIIGLRG